MPDNAHTIVYGAFVISTSRYAATTGVTNSASPGAGTLQRTMLQNIQKSGNVAPPGARSRSTTTVIRSRSTGDCSRAVVQSKK